MAYRFDFGAVWIHKGYLINGLMVTLQITVGVVVIGLFMGLVVAILNLSKFRSAKTVSRLYIEFFRNCPPLVSLLWAFYVLPVLLGFQMSRFLVCEVGLGLNVGAYMAENFRAGIQSVDRGQIEAAYSLGLSHFQTLRKVILPQAMRVILPLIMVGVVGVVKWSSLVSYLGLADLTFRGYVLSNEIFRPIEIFTTIAGIYFVVCYALASMVGILERRLGRAY